MKILIVDDSRAMRLFVKRALRQTGLPCYVSEARDGKQALDTIRQDPPDLVVCDWDMPEMSGIELLEALNAEGSLVRLGFVTPEVGPQKRARAAEAGAAFLITQPFSGEHLRATIRSTFI